MAPRRTEPETVHLSLLPCWQGLSEDEIRDHLAALLETIERENAERRMAEGESLGVKAVLRRHPHDRPKKLSRSPAPRLHAATKEAWTQLRDTYNAFAASFREAAEALEAGVLDFEFPPGNFPPNLPYVPHQANRADLRVEENRSGSRTRIAVAGWAGWVCRLPRDM